MVPSWERAHMSSIRITEQEEEAALAVREPSEGGLRFAECLLMMDDFSHEYPRPGVKDRIALLYDRFLAALQTPTPKEP